MVNRRSDTNLGNTQSAPRGGEREDYFFDQITPPPLSNRRGARTRPAFSPHAALAQRHAAEIEEEDGVKTGYGFRYRYKYEIEGGEEGALETR